MSKDDRSVMRPLQVSLDLEYNQPSRKLIQLGAVIGDLVSSKVVSRFSTFINPFEPLNPVIIELTGITQTDVDNAPYVKEAYRNFAAWVQPHSANLTKSPLTWGGGDAEDLREAVGLSLENPEWIFSRRWTDAKTVFTAWRAANNRPWDGGLARSMTKLGMTFQGRKHNAQDDAENTFLVYMALLRKFSPELVSALKHESPKP